MDRREIYQPHYPNEITISSDDMKTAIQHAEDVQVLILKVIFSW